MVGTLVVLWCWVGLWLLAMGAWAKSSVESLRQARRLRRSGVLTTAAVLSTDSSGEGYSAMVLFHTGRGRTMVRTISLLMRPERGERVEVIYDPDAPDVVDAADAAPIQGRTGGLFTELLAAMLIAAVVFGCAALATVNEVSA
jgi:hypothetical protein